MFKLTSSERETLAGPLVVGCVLGAFVGFASWGFDSEYEQLGHLRMLLNALTAFLVSLVIVNVPFGVLPIAALRRQRRKGSDDLE
ncbi:hypothetical protein [Roseateles sp. BYS96W]|uniref:Uncharacterized protein n=1 Tax=Pelomonas nitida TaxID=3299027 RepID=A0ABW7G955_9BURK